MRYFTHLTVELKKYIHFAVRKKKIEKIKKKKQKKSVTIIYLSRAYYALLFKEWWCSIATSISISSVSNLCNVYNYAIIIWAVNKE